MATNVSNHLTSGIMKYFGDAARFGPAVNLFEKLVVRDGEMASLLARSYLGMDEEVKAVQVLHRAVQDHPQSYPLLHVQCDFLRGKGKTEWAYKLAKQAVNCAPSEFVTWAKLTEVNIELKRYDEALRTLNSCIMFTYNERDLHRMPTPQRTHLPIKQFINESGILASLEAGENDNEADLALLRLPAPSLRGTFKRAYDLLSRLVTQIGWDELLKTRSEVFVMEEEYRLQKQVEGTPVVTQHDSMVEQEDGQDQAADDASVRALRVATNANTPRDGSNLASPRINGNGNNGLGSPALTDTPKSPEPPQSPIPEIRISEHEDDDDVDSDSKGKTTESKSEKSGEEAAERARSDLAGEAPGVPKPASTHLSEAHDIASDDAAREAGEGAAATKQQDSNAETQTNGDTTATSMLAPTPSFTTKRLCERWLDNLFMVLYEVSSIYHCTSDCASIH